MKKTLLILVWFMLATESGYAAGMKACFGDKCDCAEDANSCSVWMTGAGSANIGTPESRPFESDVVFQLGKWKSEIGEGMDYVAITPTRKIASLFGRTLLAYTDEDVATAKHVIEACAKRFRENCHVIVSSMAVDRFRRDIYPSLEKGMVFGLIVEADGTWSEQEFAPPIEYGPGPMPTAIISLSTDMPEKVRSSVRARLASYSADLLVPRINLFTAEVKSWSEFWQVHGNDVSRDQNAFQYVLRRLYHRVEGRFKLRSDWREIFTGPLRDELVKNVGSGAEVLQLLASQKDDPETQGKTFDRIMTDIHLERDGEQNGPATYRAKLDRYNKLDAKARLNEMPPSRDRSPRFPGTDLSDLVQKVLGTIIADRPALIVGGRVTDVSSNGRVVTVSNGGRVRRIEFVPEERGWFNVLVDGRRSGPEIHYLETSEARSAADIAEEIASKEAKLQHPAHNKHSFVLVEGAPTAPRNVALLAALREKGYFDCDVLFVDQNGDLVTTKGAVVVHSEEFLPDNVSGQGGDGRIAMALWGDVLRNATGRGVMAIKANTAARGSQTTPLGGVSVDPSPRSETAAGPNVGNRVLRARKPGATSWDFHLPEPSR